MSDTLRAALETLREELQGTQHAPRAGVECECVDCAFMRRLSGHVERGLAALAESAPTPEPPTGHDFDGSNHCRRCGVHREGPIAEWMASPCITGIQPVAPSPAPQTCATCQHAERHMGEVACRKLGITLPLMQPSFGCNRFAPRSTDGGPQ